MYLKKATAVSTPKIQSLLAGRKAAGEKQSYVLVLESKRKKILPFEQVQKQTRAGLFLISCWRSRFPLAAARPSWWTSWNTHNKWRSWFARKRAAGRSCALPSMTTNATRGCCIIFPPACPKGLVSYVFVLRRFSCTTLFFSGEYESIPPWLYTTTRSHIRISRSHPKISRSHIRPNLDTLVSFSFFLKKKSNSRLLLLALI